MELADGCNNPSLGGGVNSDCEGIKRLLLHPGVCWQMARIVDSQTPAVKGKLLCDSLKGGLLGYC